MKQGLTMFYSYRLFVTERLKPNEFPDNQEPADRHIKRSNMDTLIDAVEWLFRMVGILLLISAAFLLISAIATLFLYGLAGLVDAADLLFAAPQPEPVLAIFSHVSPVVKTLMVTL